MASFDYQTKEAPVCVIMEGDEMTLLTDGKVDKRLNVSAKNKPKLIKFLKELKPKPSISKNNLLFEIEEYADILEKNWPLKK